MQSQENKYSGPERRRYVRSEVVVVEYSIEGRAVKGLCLPNNISEGGISIIVNEDIEPNTAINLSIYISNDNKPVEIKGKVIWREDYFILPHKKHWVLGIEFIKLGQGERQRLANVVVENIPTMTQE